MTDKQIIIDNVDVSGCPYYCGHDICKNTCHYFCTPCEWVDVQNCTYKQFIRAEQTVEECHKYQAELEDKLTAKEQECEKWKKYGCFYLDKFIQLKQTLTEIKEIAENAAKCLYATKSDDYTDGYRWLGSIILQKISEVLDETSKT